MKPKEKARGLRDKMYLKIPSVYDPTGLPHYPIAKEMALIAVDEIMEELDLIREITGSSFVLETIEYYLKVKQELYKL